MKITNLTLGPYSYWGKLLLVLVLSMPIIGSFVLSQPACNPDLIPPTITCPSNITVNLQAGLCESFIPFNNVSATDNCDPSVTILQISGIPLNSYFPIGTHPVEFRALDDAANSSTCSFNIVVLEFPNPSQVLVCNNEVEITLTGNGTALINADDILEGGPYGCYDDYLVSVTNTYGFVFGNIVTCDEIGLDLIAKVTDTDSGNSCWGHIVVEDKNPPILHCPNWTIPCNSALADVPLPTLTDNCDIDPDLISAGTTPLETIACDDNTVRFQRTWYASDKYGNISLPCIDTIKVVRPLFVDFPTDIVWNCGQYASSPYITNASPLNKNVKDTKPLTDQIIEVSDTLTSYSLLGTGSGIPENIVGEYCKYSFTYSDDTISICNNAAGVFKIIRTWTVIDWCSGDVIVTGENGEDNVQVIKVLDNVPPVVSAADLTLSVNIPAAHPNPCRSTAVFPAPAVFDNCSGIANVAVITPIGPVVDGHIPFPGLEVRAQPYPFVIEATDNCGNTTDLVVMVKIVDGIAPTPICISNTQVDLESTGYAEVLAEAFDQATTDNCCLDHFEVRRMDDDACDDGINNFDFGPSVNFCCEDAGKTKTVVFRAFDCFGNHNDCMVQVDVRDKQVPVLVSCPANQRITCDWYADNLETELANLTTPAEKNQLLDQVFGTPGYYDNCNINLNRNYVSSIDQCLEGFIIRSFTATDPAGNTSPQACTQTINIDHVSDWAVEFPADLSITCGMTPPDFGEPKIFYETCELVAISYDDVIHNVVAGACYKIVRTWEVINWCVVGTNPGIIDQEVVEQPESELGLPMPQCDIDGDGDCDDRTFRDSWRSGLPANLNRPTALDANRSTGPDTDLDTDPWDGYITFQQVIKIIDNVDPVFTNGCDIPMVCITDNTCDVDLTLPTPDVMDCSSNITISAKIKLNGIWMSGFGPWPDVAPGMYEVEYNAMDNCNNQSVCNTTVKVKDCKKPTPYCKNGVIIGIMGGNPPMIPVWASDLDDNSFDNCSSDLIFSFSPDTTDTSITFFCNNQNTTTFVNVWVTDECGNQDFCSTYITVQDNGNFCADPLINLGGLILNEENESIENVEMNLSGGATEMVMTDLNGMYSFDIPSPGGDYTIIPHKDVEPLNGVSTFDLVLISKHVLGVSLLNSPYKIIAADANKSGTVSTFDIVEIRKLILFINDSFPNNTSWRFVDKNFVFPNPANPWQTPFPEFYSVNDLMDDQMSTDFVGIKIGDVNGSALTNGFSGHTDARANHSDLVFKTKDVLVKKGQEITVPFSVETVDALGFQFTLNFDKEKIALVKIGDGAVSDENFGLKLMEKGALTVSWNHPGGSGFHFENKVFEITFKAMQDGLLHEILSIDSRFTPAESYFANGSSAGVELRFEGEAAVSGFQLFQNSPNPFSEATSISFSLPKPSQCKLSLTDISGRVLKEIEGEFDAGYHAIQIKKSDFNATGVIYYHLETNDYQATKMMVLIEK